MFRKLREVILATLKTQLDFNQLNANVALI